MKSRFAGDNLSPAVKRLLCDLTRIDATNPPGNGRAAVDYAASLLDEKD